jgi:ribosomal protein L23
MKDYRDIIIRPVVTEKSMDLLADNKYTFIVDKRANKTEVKNAIEHIFKVKVESVHTSDKMEKTICGIMVERRDQVLSTFFCPVSFIFSTLLKSLASQYGPFLSDLVNSKTSFYFRLRTIILSEGFFRRVLPPMAILPQGETGYLRPTGARPSPPP